MDLATNTLEKEWAEKVRTGQDKAYMENNAVEDKDVDDAQRKVKEIKNLL